MISTISRLIFTDTNNRGLLVAIILILNELRRGSPILQAPIEEHSHNEAYPANGSRHSQKLAKNVSLSQWESSRMQS